ncbi:MULTISPECIES: ABC transporter permease [Bacillales]|jgi:ABC-2 type transport system permease protein|uniref:ABC transporter permease n=1 Tax=Brevibacillus aydinogluensis TaxID=927786 RepID=A0AA48MB57_9BACL|nr:MULTISPECIES: ABC-2 family transporter protein [Bacillales]REK66713.1 MAG: ABC transporter permease [Brevibacillus sp.]MBR8660059.1 ABC-2 family transporter protein [Brevibacillus sp. NL20B1]MDT3417779.1 ABC-2 type transport system permease protein [Brevibacillus aydinogluensis]NNV02202.1 ABC transporter permease [Brevibacillus sp. MCWH]UFJ62874.1 ABC-2 family transporter protein [Anoxybacillus sediminis]
MQNARHIIGVFADYLGQYFKTRLAYRADFFGDLVSNLIYELINLVFIIVVFQHVPLLKDWTRDEIIFIYGFFLIPYALFSMFFSFWDFNERYIIRGEMDRILTRPLHNLAQVCLESMAPDRIFGIISGLIIMGYAAFKLDLSFHWYDPLLFVVLVIGGALIYAGVYTAIAAVSFFSDSRTGIAPMIWNIQQYGRYPVDVYNKVIRFVLTYILPFAFVGVYPAAYFLRKETWYVYAAFTPVMGVIFFGIGLAIWNWGVRKYRGAGS